MSGKFEDRSDFTIPSDLIDEHEWMADAFIDSLGDECTLVFPPADEECPNCLYDLVTARSANVYKAGGPISFPANTTCPWCGGVGKRSVPVTDTITLRTYWGSSELATAIKQFKAIGGDKFADSPSGLIFVIGYMNDLAKFSKADSIIVNSLMDKLELRCRRASESIPWGFRKNRYFACMLDRQ